METAHPMAKTRYDDLLSAPTNDPKIKAIRASAQYTCRDDRFLIGKKSFDRQFAQLYFYRLTTLRPIVEEAARKRWPDVTVGKILDIPEEGEAAAVGTLYKSMQLKPSILDEYVKDRALGPHLAGARFTSTDDYMILEDDGARLTLRGDALKVEKLVTGIVAAVRGRCLPNGEFEVSDICFPGLAPQPPMPALNNDKYVALVSGLSIGNEADDPLKLDLLLDYLAGKLGGEEERKTVSRIARVVIAGGLMPGCAVLSQPTAYASARSRVNAAALIHEVDMRMTELASAVPVDLMPGASDPANYSLPQQPLHPCVLPGVGRFKSVVRATNPHEFEADGVRFLGTSGQNVDDICRYANYDDHSEVLDGLLTWRHLIPTAPDTLAAYPYADADPFIMETAPHVLFSGSQPEFSTSLVKGENGESVRVVCIPDFVSTGCLVLVNLKTLLVHPVYFGEDANYI